MTGFSHGKENEKLISKLLALGSNVGAQTYCTSATSHSMVSRYLADDSFWAGQVMAWACTARSFHVA